MRSSSTATTSRPRSAESGTSGGNSDTNTTTTKAIESNTSERNIMPSMVVRQQKLAQIGLTSFNPNKVTSSTSAQTSTQATSLNSTTNTQDLYRSAAAAAEQMGLNKSQSVGPYSSQHHVPKTSQLFDEAGLIVPKKVTPVPLIAAGSSGANIGALNSALIIPTTMHDLNRELKFNQAHGKNVLDKKSELRRAMDKLEANRRRKEAEVERLNRRSSLELRLEQRAEKIAQISGDCDNNNKTTKSTSITPTAGGQAGISSDQQPRAASAGSGRAKDVVSKVAASFNMPNTSQIKSTTR